jgi:hypothetical protein
MGYAHRNFILCIILNIQTKTLKSRVLGIFDSSPSDLPAQSLGAKFPSEDISTSIFRCGNAVSVPLSCSPQDLPLHSVLLSQMPASPLLPSFSSIPLPTGALRLGV